MINISIIIPTYDRPKKLARALRSCLNQTAAPFEVIIVDNGENPLTRTVVEELTADSQVTVRYVTSEKFAHRKALATGIEAARGEWLTLLDDDDFLVPDRIEDDSHQLDRIDEAVHMLIHDFIRVDYNHDLIWEHRMAHKQLGLYEALTLNEFPPAAAVTFRTNTIQAHHCFHLPEGWMTEFDLYANIRPQGAVSRSGRVGYIMDDTRTTDRVTGSDLEKHIQAIELHRSRFLGNRGQLNDEIAAGIDAELDAQQAFYCAKVLRMKAFTDPRSSNYCRRHIRESLKGLLSPVRGMISKRLPGLLPEMRGSKTYPLRKLRAAHPHLSQLIETAKIPDEESEWTTSK